MSVRRIAVSLAALALLATPATAEAKHDHAKPKHRAAKPLTCYAHGARTVADSPKVRVFRLAVPHRGTRTYACLYETNRAHAITIPGSRLALVRIAGTFVAYAEWTDETDYVSSVPEGVDPTRQLPTTVNLFDANLGRTVRSFHSTLRDDDSTSEVYALVVRDTGGFAWIGADDTGAEGVYKVDSSTGGSAAVLDHGPSFTQLHLRGDRLAWSRPGLQPARGKARLV
jgi:hypothetical protein